MRVLLFDNPQLVTQEQLQLKLHNVSEQRRKKALSLKFHIDRVLSVEAYRLLCDALSKEYGIEALPQFGFTNNGKPFLIDYPNIHFNISHCEQAVICVVDNFAVGVDIEAIPDKLDMDLCHYVFNEKEVQSILSAPNPSLCFTRLWTMKEAVLKLTGEGLLDNLCDLLTVELLDKVDFKIYECIDQGFVYTICSDF